MATEYEVLRGDRISGPYTGVAVRKLAAEGELRREDRIRAIGSAEWQPAGRYNNLFHAPAEGSPPTEVGTVTSPSKSISTAPQSRPAGPETTTAASTGLSVEHEGMGANDRPPISLLTIAAGLGGAAALGLSLLKPSVGAVGILGIVAGAGLILAVIVFMLRSAVAPLVAQLGPDNAAVAAARSRVGRVAWLGGLGLLVVGVASLVEFLTPRHGLTRSILALAAPKPPEPPKPPPPPPIDPKPWTAAQFVLVNPDQDAVAIRHEANPPAFHVLALASGGDVRKVMKVAASHGVQIIDEKPDLARRVAAYTEPGLVPGRLAGELGDLWRVHQYLPAHSTLVTFQDVKEGRSRVGFLVDRRPEEVTFVPLSPKRGAGGDPFVTETVRRADVRTGSQRVNLNDAHVRDVADFLDYSVYRILEKLSSSQRGAGYVRVVVEPVTYDDTKLKGIKEQLASLSERYLKELKIKAKYNIVDETVNAKFKGTINAQEKRKSLAQRNAQKNRSPGYGPSLGGNMGNGLPPYGPSFGGESETETETQKETEQTDTKVDFEGAIDVVRNRAIRGDAEAKQFLREFDLEERRLREMEAETGTVTAELRTRLNNAGVSVLERSRLDALEAERKLARLGGPESDPEEQYLGATHILLAEIRDRRGPGKYHLSTRLVKVGTREIVAEVEGERTPPLSVAYTPPVDTPFMLKTGRLVVVEFADDVRPRTDLNYRSYPGGYPVSLPFNGLVPLSDDDKFIERERLRILKIRGNTGVTVYQTPILEGMNKRIGFLDDLSTPDPEQSPYRVLVGMDLSSDAARKGLPFDRVPFRDLFGDEPVPLELSKIKSVIEVNGNSVPEAHRMRFVVYQIASSILPPAGRITMLGDNDLLTVSLGHQSGLQASDRLRVLRPGLSDRLDFELQVREVQDAFSRVIFDQNERLFADRYGPQVGDFVHRRADRSVSLAVLPFKVEDPNANAMPNRSRGQFAPPVMRNNPPPKAVLAAQRNSSLANELEGKLREALRSRCNVPLADASVATHVVEGRVTFSSNQDYIVPAHLRVTDQATKKIVLELDFKFSEQEGRNWKP